MKSTWTERSIALVFVIAALAVTLACDDKKAERTEQKEVVQDTKPALSVNAFQLVNDYKSNEIAADGRYKGKVLEVSGTIESIAKDIMDTMYVSLEGGGEFEMRGVQCYFADSENSKLAKLSKGQQITIRGKCDGLMMNVLIKECLIVK